MPVVLVPVSVMKLYRILVQDKSIPSLAIRQVLTTCLHKYSEQYLKNKPKCVLSLFYDRLLSEKELVSLHSVRMFRIKK